jgi:hypothetical protein
LSIDLSQFGYPTAEEAKGKLFEAMQEYGVHHLEASYSGGNDEGGVDELEVLKDADGNDIEVEGLGWQHPLQSAVDSVLSVDFGSWAGDFSASGTLHADRKENKVWRTGSTSQYVDDAHDY